MALLRTHPPQKLYRGAIILACFAFLLGVAGIFHFQRRDAQRRPVEDAATVLVHGLPEGGSARVSVEWTHPGGGPAEREIGRRSEAEGEWTFHRAPEGVPLTLVIEVHGDGIRREVARHPAILTRGGLFEHFVRPQRAR